MSWDDEDKYAKHARRQVQLKKQKQLKMIMPMVFVVLGILSCGALFLFFHFMTGSEYDDALEDEARNGSKAASMGGNGGLQWPWSRASLRRHAAAEAVVWIDDHGPTPCARSVNYEETPVA